GSLYVSTYEGTSTTRVDYALTRSRGPQLPHIVTWNEQLAAQPLCVRHVEPQSCGTRREPCRRQTRRQLRVIDLRDHVRRRTDGERRIELGRRTRVEIAGAGREARTDGAAGRARELDFGTVEVVVPRIDRVAPEDLERR